MKKLRVPMVAIVLMFVLVACGGNKVDDATAEKYIALAEEIIELLNEGSYEAIYDTFNDEMKAGLPVENMKELEPIIEESGTLQKINKASVEENEGLYVTVLVAKYSKENRVFTISFNDENEVAGLFIQ